MLARSKVRKLSGHSPLRTSRPTEICRFLRHMNQPNQRNSCPSLGSRHLTTVDHTQLNRSRKKSLLLDTKKTRVYPGIGNKSAEQNTIIAKRHRARKRSPLQSIRSSKSRSQSPVLQSQMPKDS